MAKTKAAQSPFAGTWRITWMSAWDQKYVNEEVEGYFEFNDRDSGEFQFSYVHGFIDSRSTTRDGKSCIEFSWEGNDEMERAMGRGWAMIDGDQIDGMLFFHQGDESAFRAKRRSVTSRRRV